MTNGIPSDDLKRLGKAFAALRISCGYSQNALEQATGVAQSSVSRMESGKNFYFGNLLLLLKELDKKPGDFFIDAGFTSVSTRYKRYKIVLEVDAAGIKSVVGSVNGEGIRRAEKEQP